MKNTHEYTIPLPAYGEERDLVNSNIEFEHKCSGPGCSLFEILLEKELRQSINPF